MTAAQEQAIARVCAHECQAQELLAALEQFVAQWNACGPNSEFGRHFQSVRDTAVAVIQREKNA